MDCRVLGCSHAARPWSWAKPGGRRRGSVLRVLAVCAAAVVLIVFHIGHGHGLVFADLSEGEERRRQELSTVLGLFGTVILLPIIFAASQDAAAEVVLWKILDQSLAIFLAVSWFSAYKEMGTKSKMRDMFLAYAGSCCLLWCLKFQPKLMHATCSISSHFVAFASIAAADRVQWAYFGSSACGAISCCFLFLMIHLGLWACKHWLTRYLATSEKNKRRHMRHVRVHRPGHKAQHASCRAMSKEEAVHEWCEATDDLGWDVAAMCLAYMSTQSLHGIVFGSWGSLDEGHFANSWEEATFFLVYAAVMQNLGKLLLPKVSIAEMPESPSNSWKEEKAWWKSNLSHLFMTVMPMTSAWGYLISSKFLTDRALFADFTEVFQSIALALAVSYLAVPVMLYLGWAHKPSSRQFQVLVRVMSLVIAWPWERAFDAAYEGSKLSSKAQLIMATTLTCVLGPIYCKYIQPRSHSEE